MAAAAAVRDHPRPVRSNAKGQEAMVPSQCKVEVSCSAWAVSPAITSRIVSHLNRAMSVY